MDRFGELLAFVRTVERGSQSAAARELNLTPAMVGRHIRAIEARLGTRLLNRTTQRQSLTEAGAGFFRQAASILDQLEDAERAAAEQAPEPHGVLRVNGPMAFGWRHLAPAVTGFCARHDKLRVELVLNDRMVDLVEEGFDVAVRIGALGDSSLVARRLADCPLLVCAAPAYLAAHGTPRSPAELRAHRCLLYSYSPAPDRWRFADGAEVQVAGPLTANNGDALLAAAVAGQGITLQPAFIVGDALRDGRLVRLLPGHPPRRIAVHAAFPSARQLAPKVRRFVDFLAAHFRFAPWAAD